MSVCSALQQFLNHSHEFDIVEFVFITIIAKFGLGMKDLVTYLTNSLPKKLKFPTRKMMAIKVCSCKDISTKHYIVEQCTDGQSMYTVNFQSHSIEITQNSDNDRRFLTHLLIMLIRTREGCWTSSSTSSNEKAHEIALRLGPYIVEEIALSSSSESDLEKENSPVKKSLKRVKQMYQDIHNNKKKIKLAPSRQRNFVSLCKTAMVAYQQERKQVEDLVKALPFTVETSFITVDNKVLTEKIADLVRKKSEQETDDILYGTTNFKTGELEALYCRFQSAKNVCLNSLLKFKEEVKQKLEAVRVEQVAEAERAAQAETAAEAERSAEAQWAAENLEQELIKVAAEAQKDSPAEVNSQQHSCLEDGEISELDRAHQYYRRAIQVAAKFAVFAENFAPCLRPLTNYSNQSLRLMHAHCRTAMNSNNDALVARMEHDPTLLWHGPPLPSVPVDLPDLVAEIENMKQMQQM